VKVEFTVNEERRTVNAAPMERLLDVLRHQLGLTGTKEGCGEGECGACSVLLDGALVNSCLVPVGQVAGARVCTIEGLAKDGELHPIQKSFLLHGGAQCGICTPGMTLAAAYLLERNPHPTLDEVREGLAGNLCRCTGYMKIFDAVRLTYAEAAGNTNTGVLRSAQDDEISGGVRTQDDEISGALRAEG
jgi:carbon-monoxide dehydrogenase small subunit